MSSSANGEQGYIAVGVSEMIHCSCIVVGGVQKVAPVDFRRLAYERGHVAYKGNVMTQIVPSGSKFHVLPMAVRVLPSTARYSRLISDAIADRGQTFRHELEPRVNAW
jgi:hypothetical protein